MYNPKTCVLFGHRVIMNADLVKQKLYCEIEKQIKNGCLTYLLGSHGEFDKIALSVCKELNTIYGIEIIVVFTSLNTFQKDSYGFAKIDNYENVKHRVYEIENEYFKNKIIKSNQLMVEDSDIVICYVDLDKKLSGAGRAIRYAEKRNKKIINIFSKQDNPLFNLDNEEFYELLNKYLKE